MKSIDNVIAIVLSHFRVVIVSSAIILTGFYSNAQLIKVPLAQRAHESDLIVEGKVNAQRSFWNRDHTMIYTASTIEIFKIFKGDISSSSIEILTEGGVVGESMIRVTPSLPLETGDIGIFTCEQVRRFKPGRQKSALPQYEVYASVQGFIQYDLRTQTASDIFSKYWDIENELYKTLLLEGRASYRTVKHFDIHGNNGPSILVTGFSPATFSAGTGSASLYQTLKNSGTNVNSATSSFAAITSFSPTTVSAGTGSTITITGNSFGATRGSGSVGFRNAEDGGATFIFPLASQYLSWSDTEIAVEVPANAGSGTIRVTQGTTMTSSSPLTITFSHQNVDFDPGPGTVADQTDLINDNGAGGYTLRMISASTPMLRPGLPSCAPSTHGDVLPA